MKNTAILLVEDNPDDEMLTLRALKKINIINEISVVRDGEEALQFLFGDAHKDSLPLMVLLDLKLPKLNGLEVLREIRANKRTKSLPVVIFTSSNEEKDILESYNLGVNSYVRKPVDSTQFFDAVSQIGLYWMVLNEPVVK
jgi:CheY-like chemotaxis protein